MKELIVIFSLLCLIACTTGQKKDTKKVTEDFTGATAVKTGQEMKSQIDSINKIQTERSEELDELLK